MYTFIHADVLHNCTYMYIRVWHHGMKNCSIIRPFCNLLISLNYQQHNEINKSNNKSVFDNKGIMLCDIESVMINS